MGEQYCEPQGEATIRNLVTGDHCDIYFKPRGRWSTSEEDKQFVSATVKSKNGMQKYTV